MRELLIVHHRPVRVDAGEAYEGLTRLLSSLLDARVNHVDVDSLEGYNASPDLVVSLFVFSGGHHETVAERFGDRVVGPLNEAVVIEHILRHYTGLPGGGGGRGVTLIYYASRRRLREREEAARRLARRLSNLLGVEVESTPYEYGGRVECADNRVYAPLVMAPSKLTEILDGQGCTRLPSILEGSMDLVASWITGVLDGFQRCG